MRTDIASMGPGRACAMASHATNAFMQKHGERHDVTAWAKSTSQGFGTAIVLSVDLKEMKRLVGVCQALPNKVAPSDVVTDPDYRFSVTDEILPLIDQSKINNYEYSGEVENTIIISKVEHTCAYIFGEKETLEPILKDLALYPN